MIGENRYLGGYLVGIGKRKTNGEVVYQELDKPIHNRITSVGLDHLFQFSGSSKPDLTSSTSYVPYLWVDKGGNKTYGFRAGAINYMSFGSGNTATAFTDTALANEIATPIETKYVASGSSSTQTLNGVHVNSFGNYSFRVSHESDAAASSVTINEIGWWGAYGTTSTYSNKVLFARVVLPSPITLSTGEKLITTYQLDEVNANTSVSSISDFFGLKDSDGNTLQAQQRITRYETGYSHTGFNAVISEPYITSAGTGAMNNATEMNGFSPAYTVLESSTLYGYFAYNDTGTNTGFPTRDERVYYVATKFSNGGGTYSASLDTYNGVGSTNKYRDKIYVVGAMNPGMSSTSDYKDIYCLVLNGMMYRFGYDDNGTWTPQAWRKYANQQVTFTFRTRYSTEDTTIS